ncbi:MAG: ATPase, T2SS/T4P/T4SS family, partial [Bacillota bacterium]|nr:ATPase, T2SS/T4P/T4SS family [Bacillota bacterium]
TLVISPPQAGKTTLLRDIARQLSDKGQRVCIVDERSEIAGCYNGCPQLDVGLRTDVMDGCPKAEGMLMALRALSPDVIITDEIGRAEDAAAIEEALNSGVRVIASAHGSTYEEVAARPNLSTLLQRGLFQRVVILSNRRGPGTIEYIGPVFRQKGEQHAHHS